MKLVLYFYQDLLHQAVELTGARRIDTCGFFSEPQVPQDAQRIAILYVLRALNTQGHLSLSSKIIDFIHMEILAKVIDPVGVVYEACQLS